MFELIIRLSISLSFYLQWNAGKNCKCNKFFFSSKHIVAHMMYSSSIQLIKRSVVHTGATKQRFARFYCSFSPSSSPFTYLTWECAVFGFLIVATTIFFCHQNNVNVTRFLFGEVKLDSMRNIKHKNLFIATQSTANSIKKVNKFIQTKQNRNKVKINKWKLPEKIIQWNRMENDNRSPIIEFSTN